MRDTADVSGEDQLLTSWRSVGGSFGHWVRGIAQAHAESGLTLEAAASLVGATPAELEAVLQLALLGDEELDLFSEAPPKTSWFLFASASEAGIRAGLDALATRGARSAYDVVVEALYEVEGPSEQERVAALPWDVFSHMAKKAQQYKQLRDKDWKALKDFASRKKGGRTLTPAQVAYATGLLEQLADAGVISHRSMDDDQEICDRVLEALGRS